MKTASFSFLFASLFSLFFCIERCTSHSNKVENHNLQIKSYYSAYEFEELNVLTNEPVMPVVSKYALFFAFTFGITSCILVLKSRDSKSTLTDYMKIQSQQKLSSTENKQIEKVKE